MAALIHSTPSIIAPAPAVLALRLFEALGKREHVEELVENLIAMLDSTDAPGEDREVDDDDGCAVEDAPIVKFSSRPSDEADDEDDADAEDLRDPANWMVWGGAREATPVSALLRRT
jgi:hypothetical protein